MNMLARVMLFLTAVTAWPAAAQNWDNSGNNLLSGTFYFRDTAWYLGDQYGDLTDGVAAYGNITFDGKGNYSITAQIFDAGVGTPQPLAVTGTYSISASGYGFLSSPISTGDTVFGLVSQGIFIGSTTENQSNFNDLFIAAPVGASLASNATLKGTYAVADLDSPATGAPTEYRESLLQMTADGAGNLGTVTASGYIGAQGSAAVRQNLNNVKYAFSSGAANVHFGGSFTNNNIDTALIEGDHYLYISPDGNFVFGGSPTGWDMLVGVRTSGTAPNVNGLFYQAGMDLYVAQASNGSADFDTFFGSYFANNGTLLQHQRTLDALDFVAGFPAFDATYSDTYTTNADGTADDSFQHYYFGNNGAIRIGIGVPTRYPYFSVSVALAAPTFSGPGVYLNPTGIENAGSSALFTSSIAPGELIALYGTGLASDVTSNYMMPTTLDGIQVMINGIAAPIYVTSPSELTVMVPYEIPAGTFIADIQVMNKGVPSNTISAFVGLTAPGVFTNPVGGLGYAAAEHLDGSLITPSSPAQGGETISVYMTGLGALTPAVTSGSPGPSNPIASTSNEVDAYIGGTQATVTFEGLTPTAVGLYQVNLVVPSGLASGDNIIEFAGPDSDNFESLISIGGGVSAAAQSSTPRLNVMHGRRRIAKPAAEHPHHSLMNPRLMKPLAGQ